MSYGIAQKFRVHKKVAKEREAAQTKTISRIKRYSGLSDPNTNAITKYIQALDSLLDEFERLFGPLGGDHTEPKRTILQERSQALKLLAKLRINSVKPGSL